MSRNLNFIIGLVLLAGMNLLSCSDDSSDKNPGPDASPALDQAVTIEDQSLVPDQPQLQPDQPVLQPDQKVEPLTELKVAAVQYSAGDFSAVPGCPDDLCGLTHFITEAAAAGAKLVATAEYTTGKYATEPAPAVGDTPVSDSRWAEGTFIKTLAKLADDKNITLIFDLLTDEGGKGYNTLVVVDDTGTVVARHFKFELFGSEKVVLSPGTSVAQSFFSTPAGKAGVLICADVQCIIAGMTPTVDCSAASIDLLKDFFTVEKPDLVVLSSMWTVGGLSNPWGSINVQKTVAKEGKAYLIAANTTQGDGKGGGIYDPAGAEIVKTLSSKPSIIYAELPLK